MFEVTDSCKVACSSMLDEHLVQRDLLHVGVFHSLKVVCLVGMANNLGTE